MFFPGDPDRKTQVANHLCYKQQVDEVFKTATEMWSVAECY